MWKIQYINIILVLCCKTTYCLGLWVLQYLEIQLESCYYLVKLFSKHIKLVSCLFGLHNCAETIRQSNPLTENVRTIIRIINHVAQI